MRDVFLLKWLDSKFSILILFYVKFKCPSMSLGHVKETIDKFIGKDKTLGVLLLDR